MDGLRLLAALDDQQRHGRHGQQRAGDVEDGGADAAGLRQLGALGVDNDGLLGEQADQTVALFLAELLVDGDLRIRALDKAGVLRFLPACRCRT